MYTKPGPVGFFEVRSLYVNRKSMVDNYFEDEIFDENYNNEYHNMDLLTGKLRCFRAAKYSCNELLRVLRQKRYRYLWSIIEKIKQRFKSLHRAFPDNRTYRGMYLLMRDLKQMYTNTDYATMEEELARIHVIVNNYVQDHVYTDITTRTNNATNIIIINSKLDLSFFYCVIITINGQNN